MTSPGIQGEDLRGLAVDQASRDAVITALAYNTVVSAGAGTGKTTSLVGRICALVESGLHISEIAAITFTEAATAELRQRVRAKLTDRLTSSADTVGGDGQAPKVVADSVEDLDEAAISTIHSFAQRILRDHCFEAGLPPGFEVLDEPAARSDFDVSWRGFLESLLGSKEFRTTMLRGLTVGLNLESLHKLALEMAEYGHLLGIDQMDLEAGDVSNSVDSGGRIYDSDNLWRSIGALCDQLAAVGSMAGLCTSTSADGLLAHILEVIGPLEKVLTSAVDLGDDIGALSAVGAAGALKATRTGQAKNWAGQIEKVREACREADAIRSAVLQQVRSAVLDLLLAELRTFTVSEFLRRRRDGRLTYQDLLVNAWLLVRRRPEARASLKRQFRHLLVDELQDTDPLQLELAYLVTRDDSDAADEKVTFFAVGDPKQSIYRFRGADSALFAHAGSQADMQLDLVLNFRTLPGIIDWVNHLFGRWFDAGSPTQSRYTPLVAARQRFTDVGRPAVGYVGGPIDASAREIRDTSAAACAAVVAQIHRDRWLVAGPLGKTNADGIRPARWSDIAVLLPTRGGLRSLTRALDRADVPYRIEGASLLWEADEVADVVTVLRAIADPGNPVRVLGALRTVLLGCGDDDLARWAGADGKWDPREIDGSQEGSVRRAMGQISTLHRLSLGSSASDVVDELLRDLDAFELALVYPRPREAWHRLRWILDQARAADERGAGTLARFLDWCELQVSENPAGANAGPPDPDDDAVRIMTVHASKGLEFPVVLLTGLGQGRSSTPARVLAGSDGELQFKAGDLETRGYHEAYEIDKALDREEQVRLMYVATTRARDHLVVDLHHKRPARGTSDCLAGQMLALCDGSDLWADLPLTDIDSPSGNQPGAVSASVDELRKTSATTDESRQRGSRLDAYTRDRLPSLWEDVVCRLASVRQQLDTERMVQSPAVAASSLEGGTGSDPASGATGARTLLRTPRDRLRPDRSKTGRYSGGSKGSGTLSRLDRDTAVSIGRAVHQMLATADLTGEVPADMGDRAARVAERFRVGHHSGLVETMARRALMCPVVAEAGTRRHWQEMALGAPVKSTESVVIEGAADLVYDSEDGLVVIDYKTDFVADTSDIAASAERHYPQLHAYSRAIEQATGRRVVKAVLCFLACDPPIEHAVEIQRP